MKESDPFNTDEQIAEALGRTGTVPTDEEMIEALLDLGHLCEAVDKVTEVQENN